MHLLFNDFVRMMVVLTLIIIYFCVRTCCVYMYIYILCSENKHCSSYSSSISINSKKKKSCHHREQNGKIRGNDIDNNLNKIAWKYNAIKVNAV